MMAVIVISIIVVVAVLYLAARAVGNIRLALDAERAEIDKAWKALDAAQRELDARMQRIAAHDRKQYTADHTANPFPKG